MKLLVYMRDGRTVYLIVGRAELRRLTGAEPGHEEKGAVVARGIWNPVTGEYVWTRGVRLRFLAKGSVGVVEEAPPGIIELAEPVAVEAA